MATAKKQKDGSWRIQPCVTVLGEKRRTNIRADSKREAERLAQEWIECQGKPKPKADMTVREAVLQFIENRKTVLSPSTVKRYYSIAKSGFPDLMDKKISSVTPEMMQKVVNDFSKNHKPKTVANIHGLISSALKAVSAAVELDTTLPQKEKADIRIPSREEVSVLMERARGKSIRLPMMLALFCGLRESEVAALKASSIHIQERVCFIRVKEALVDGYDGPTLKQPKTTSGYRDIPLHRDFCNELITATKENADGRVTKFTSKGLSRAWIRFFEKVPLEHVTFHALRHFYASNALLNNVPIDYVVAMMGHSSRAMVDRVYKHIFPESQFEFAERVVNEYERYAGDDLTKSEPKSEP